MTRNPVLIEVGVAVAIAAVIFVLQPGVAWGGALAVLVLLVCAATLLVDRRRVSLDGRRARRPERR